MKTSLARHLIAAALLAALAACGNKGPLVKPSAAEAPTSDAAAPAPAEPAETPSPEAAPVPPVDAPDTTPPADVPPADDSGGNG